MTNTNIVLTIKNKDNQNIAVVELWIDSDPNSYHLRNKYIDLTSNIMIQAYSQLLCNVDPMKRSEFVSAFTQVSVLHTWLEEMHRHGNLPDRDDVDDRYEEVLGLIRKKLRHISEDFGLIYEEE